MIEFTLLGTGSSGGVPRVGNQWGACDPSDPHNRRRRCAILVRRGKDEQRTSVLVDAGADLREQLLSANVKDLDAVLLTHPHADHIFGLDDLRQLAMLLRKRIPVYMDENTSQIVMRSFGYVFEQAPGSSYPAFCDRQPINANQPITIEGPGGQLDAVPFEVEHGDIHALGFRIGDFAYIPDVKRIDTDIMEQHLQAVDVLVVDALRYKSHPSHMNVEEALALIERLKPHRAVLTNMHSDLDYKTLGDQLPDNTVAGYDGLVLTCS